MKPTNPPPTRAFVEHVAVRVRDIHWHLRFFHDVLGMDLREVDGNPDDPRQAWTLGGMQFIASPDFQAPPSNDSGWLAHLGIMVDNLDAALEAASRFQVTALPQGRHWLQLPDGLAVELIEAQPGSVAAALAVKARP